VPASCKQLVDRVVPIAMLMAGLTAAGCQWWSDDLTPAPALLPVEQSGQAAADARNAQAPVPSELRAVLAEANGWMRFGRSVDSGRCRWQYPAMDDLLALPPEQRPDFHEALDDANPVVAANAAIGLARLGDASAGPQLVKAIRTRSLKLSIRRAAAETLGVLREPSPASRIRELIDEYADKQDQTGPHPVPELHAELIRSLSRHVAPAQDPRFVDALRSPAADVRLAAMTAWAEDRRGEMPLEAVDLRADSDRRVRAAAVRALATRRHPRAHKYMAAALNDHQLQVRMAAIEGLGQLGDAPSIETLKQLQGSRAELIRAAAVAALATAGAEEAVRGAARDKSWRVRLETAKALRKYPNRAGNAMALRLVDDPSPAVQQQVLAAMADWPLEQAGPVLLAAMQKRAYTTRTSAARQLAARWKPAIEFPVEGPDQRRAEMLDRLRRQFHQQFGFANVAASRVADGAQARASRSIPPEQLAEVQRLLRQLSDPRCSQTARRQAVQALVNFGPGLVEVLEQLALDRKQPLPEVVYREILPLRDPVFVVLDRLNSEEVLVRRRAAGDLVDLASEQPPGPLALTRLASIVATEPDQLVWQSVLTSVASNASEPSIRMAYTAIGHSSPEVRRRACQHLAAHADPRHAKVLLPALNDPSVPVAQAAVRALGAAGRLDDMRPLEQLLATGHESLRTDAAIALARLGNRTGTAALERLAYSGNWEIRRQVATAMGELADPAFTPTLIRLLDDRQSVCRAALDSLPKVVGHDVDHGPNRAPSNTTEKIELWKRWFQRHATDLGTRQNAPRRK